VPRCAGQAPLSAPRSTRPPRALIEGAHPRCGFRKWLGQNFWNPQARPAQRSTPRQVIEGAPSANRAGRRGATLGARSGMRSAAPQPCEPDQSPHSSAVRYLRSSSDSPALANCAVIRPSTPLRKSGHDQTIRKGASAWSDAL
jgi:hypothetical protein